MKVLIIRFSSIGDIVLTTPIIRCVKKQLGTEVHYLTKGVFASLVDANPYIDKLHLFDKDMTSVLTPLEKEAFDIVIDLHNNIRTFHVKRKLGAKSFTLDKINIRKWMAVQLKRIDLLPDQHIVEREFDCIRELNVVNDQDGLDFYINPKNIDSELFRDIVDRDYVALAIGGSYFTKKLPVDKLIHICDRLNKPVVLIGGSNDYEVGECISRKSSKRIFNKCGKFNFHESALCIDKARCVITHDTGMMHIAAALKKDVISVWGNTIPEFGMYPYSPGKQSRIFQNEALSCRPCSKLGYSKCPKGHFKCMEELDVDAISTYANTI